MNFMVNCGFLSHLCIVIKCKLPGELKLEHFSGLSRELGSDLFLYELIHKL